MSIRCGRSEGVRVLCVRLWFERSFIDNDCGVFEEELCPV